MATTSSRDVILARVRSSLGRSPDSSIPPAVPGRVAPRVAGPPVAELDSFLDELNKVGARTDRIRPADLVVALDSLVTAQSIRKATMWETPQLQSLGLGATLCALGVEILSPHADKHVLAACDLGVTGVDAAFPETGTMLLRSTPDRPRIVSLMPRIHLALVDPAVLQPDLSPALQQVKGEGHWVFVTGPSRTADIELTTTIGVHGPKMLIVWALVG